MNVERSQESLKPELPLTVESVQDVIDRLDKAEADVAAGRVAPAASASSRLRAKYGLRESPDVAIRRGIEDVAAGRARPADEVFASIRSELAE